MTNETILMSMISDETPLMEFQPQNNIQAYLAYLCGKEINLPTPRTNEEALLYQLCLNGGASGGGVKFTGIDGRYLFADNARMDKIDETLAMCSELTSLEYMFYGSDDTRFTFDMSKIDTSKVTTMKMMFAASGVTSVDASKSDMDACTEYESMFHNCRHLEEIVGFSAPYGNLTYPVGFPKGSSSTKYKLKRLTFRTDLPCAIRSSIDIRFNSFDRNGMVEMFNTLPDVSALGLPDYKATIIITGNPCVTDGTLTDEDRAIATNKGWYLTEA